jgi:hypothetical protein
MSVLLKGAASTATWGVPTAIYSGRVLRVTKTTSGEEVPLDNSEGETDGLAMLNQKDEVDIELIYDSTFTPPSYGDSFTVASVVGLVLNIAVNWEYKGWRKATVKVTDWATLTP